MRRSAASGADGHNDPNGNRHSNCHGASAYSHSYANGGSSSRTGSADSYGGRGAGTAS